VGENPNAADAAGVSVVGLRLTYTCVAGVCSGIAGAVISLGIVGTWQTGVTAGQGWVAFALVFFAAWRPLGVLAGAYVFGALSALGNLAQAEGWSLPPQLFVALPYLATIGLMILRGAIVKVRGVPEEWPASLGHTYYRA
jgi:simple sugar transport system permease protein